MENTERHVEGWPKGSSVVILTSDINVTDQEVFPNVSLSDIMSKVRTYDKLLLLPVSVKCSAVLLSGCLTRQSKCVGSEAPNLT
jgi:hypothetical protein